MQLRLFKFFLPLLLYSGAIVSFHSHGWTIAIPLIIAWIIIPVSEMIIKPDPRNLSTAEEEMARHHRGYDLLLYFVVIIQYTAVIDFLRSMHDTSLTTAEIIGRIWVMGLLCGTFGINVGHELGHRVNTFEQFLAKALLLTSLYMHFFTEHNKGHHKRVATPGDPSSARYGEPVYIFYFRTIIFSYISAWKIANHEQVRKGRSVISITNEMIVFTLVQVVFLLSILFIFGWVITCYFIAAAFIGILLLETVNYIEHYGLQRKPTKNGFERARPEHSWNSDHVVGRLMLFELSRHSDHHFQASRKYQVLRHHDQAPQMPTGYPGMMILSLVPPLWFRVMNPRVRKFSENPGS